LPTAQLARYQVSVILDPVTGEEVPAGGNSGRNNNDWWKNDEASGSNTSNTLFVSKE
jgi:hypothetical protein